MAELLVDIEAQVGDFPLRVDFHVEGQAVAVLGPSGAGKTLTLRAIAGLLRPQAGRIVLDNRPLYDERLRTWVPVRQRRIGYVFQHYALFPHLTVTQNLSYGLAGWPSDQVRRRVAELVELLELRELTERAPAQLSGGQQQRVALGRALAPHPTLMLLDEPFSALDTPTRAALTEQFRRLQGRLDSTTVLVTHDVAEAYGLASHLVVLNEGRVIQQGPREQVFRHPASPEAARVLGVRNLLPGTVIGADHQTTLVEVQGLRLSAGASGLKRDTAVTVGIRPQEITLRPGPVPQDGGLANLVSGSLVERIGRGTHHDLILVLDTPAGNGPKLLVEVGKASYDALDPGTLSEWTVAIPPSAVHLWPVT